MLEAARQALANAGDEALIAGASDLTRAGDMARVADRVGRLSEVAALAGATDVAQGIELLAASDDIATISDLVGVMSEADLEHGLKLARLSGELRAAGTIVKRIEMPILAKFLHGRSTQLDHLAVNTVLRASSTRVLAVAMAATGARVADLSEQEVTEGIVRLAASEALAEEADDLAADSALTAVRGIGELENLEELRTAARAEAGWGVAKVARGSAELGAAAVEGAVADELQRRVEP